MTRSLGTSLPLALPLALLLALALLASACGSAGSSMPTTSAPNTTVAATTIAPTTAPPATTPAATTTPPTTVAVDEEVTVPWFRDQVVAWMSGEGPVTQAEFERIFAPRFQAVASLDEVNSIFAQVSPLGPWKVIETLGEAEDGGGYVMQGSMPEPQLLLSIEVQDGQVVDARFQPWAGKIESFEEAVATIDELGRSSYLIAETTSGSCVPVIDSRGDEIMPIGSVFKLIVLGAVVDAVAAGTITWDDPLEVRDELDSLPSGTTQDVPAGTMLTVREMAELMISISDNTATDHLIDLVGRDAVEAAQASYGVQQPELNMPFLTTRELFIVKLDPDVRARYLEADEAGRREILVEVADLQLPDLDSSVAGWTAPIEVDRLEWFATHGDVCRMLLALNADAEATAILQLNPGPGDSSDRWTSIGFKGGSELGLLAVAWIVTDADGRTFTMAGATVSDTGVNETAAITAFAGLRDLFTAP